jgi:hypothetical protein
MGQIRGSDSRARTKMMGGMVTDFPLKKDPAELMILSGDIAIY